MNSHGLQPTSGVRLPKADFSTLPTFSREKVLHVTMRGIKCFAISEHKCLWAPTRKRAQNLHKLQFAMGDGKTMNIN